MFFDRLRMSGFALGDDESGTRERLRRLDT